MAVVLWVAAIPVPAGLLPIADAEPNPWPVTIWSGILIGILLVLFLVVSAIRRSMRSDEASGGSAGFTLGDLRSLHRQGKMTDEEFEKAKALLIGQTRRDTERALEAKSQKLKTDLNVRPDTAADLAAFAQALREKAARERAADDRQPPPPATPATGEE